ncbi:hypothetical protein Aab01nite_43540 [Paractinoplanes abujensis]|nr:hypothetical protein Aab01nite_43540 [Actinoplanes abujensis]
MLATALLTGCTSAPKAEPPAGPTVAPAPTEASPTEVVQAALQRLTTTPYSFAISGEGQGLKYVASGAHDPKARKHRWKFTVSRKQRSTSHQVIVIGGIGYLNRGGSGRWARTDLTRLEPTSLSRYADPADPSGLIRFARAVQSVRRLGPATYEGDARLEAAPEVISYVPPGAPLVRFPQGAPWVAFTLTTDAKGNPATLKTVFEFGASEVVTNRTTFRELGRPVRISKP